MDMEPHLRIKERQAGVAIDTTKSLLREWFKTSMEAKGFYLFGRAPEIESIDPGPEAAYALDEQANDPTPRGDYRLNLPDPLVSNPALQDMSLYTNQQSSNTDFNGDLIRKQK